MFLGVAQSVLICGQERLLEIISLFSVVGQAAIGPITNATFVDDAENEEQPDQCRARGHYYLFEFTLSVLYIRIHGLECCMEHLVVCALLINQCFYLSPTVEVVDQVAPKAPQRNKCQAKEPPREEEDVEGALSDLLIVEHCD